MSERPNFLDELKDELTVAADVAARRHTSRRRWTGVGAGAVAAGALGIMLVTGTGDRLDTDENEQVEAVSDDETANQDGSDTEQDPSTDQVGRWETAPSGIGGEALPTVVWTGEEILIVRTENRGNDVVGERVDPATGRASDIAESGLNWRVSAATAWTGSELLMIGGSNGPGLNQIGSAYNPERDTWRPLADPIPEEPADFGNRFWGPSAWTGDELLTWPAAQAYNPATDTWRPLTSHPAVERPGTVSVWTGNELVVWGGCEGPGCDDAATGGRNSGAAYDPGTDSWRELSESPLPPTTDAIAVWSGTEVLVAVTGSVADGEPTAAAYHPQRDEWRALAPWPLATRRDAAGVWAEGRFVVWGGGTQATDAGMNSGAVYDPGTDTWTGLAASPGPGRSLHTMAVGPDFVYISATRTIAPPLLLRDIAPDTQEPVIEQRIVALDPPAVDRDGDTLVHDIRLQTGERLRLEVPAAFAGDLTLIDGPARRPVTIEGSSGRIAVSFQPCVAGEAEDLDPSNDVGPQVTLCGENSLLTMTVQPSADLTAADIERFNLRIIESGTRYGPILTSAYEETRSCGNCVPWGPMVYPEQALAIHRIGPATVAAVDLMDSLKTVWTVTFDDHTGPDLNLFAQDDGVLVDLVGGPIIKLDLNGDEQWRIERLSGERQLDVFGAFLLSSFTDDGDNRSPLLRRIDLATGEVAWEFVGRPDADWQVASSAIFGNTLVVMDLRDQPANGTISTLSGIDISTGQQLWTVDLGVTARQAERGLIALFDFEDGRGLFVRTSDGDVLRVDPPTGQTLWRTAASAIRFGGTEFDSNGALALDVVTSSGRVLLDPETGQVVGGGAVNGDTGGVFTCPVTIPDLGYTPPEPWPSTPSTPDSVWYGDGELWTALNRTGHAPRKSVWWSTEFAGGAAEPQPEISVSYQRLDADAAADGDAGRDEDTDQLGVVFESPGTNAFTPEDGDFMINGIEPDTPGCWQATATYKGATLSYVYEVD